MKKIYLSTASVLVTASALVTQALAAAPSISVSTDKSNVSYTYTAVNGDETVADAAKLFGDFAEVSDTEYSSENLTITSESADGNKVEVLLRLDAEKTDYTYSVLDYYTFVIADGDGNVIYDGEAEAAADAQASEKEISFGVFNSEEAAETRTYTVDYKLNPEVVSALDGAAANLKVSIASRVVDDVEEPDYKVSVTARTPEPDTEVAEAVDAVTDTASTAAPEVTSTPEAIEINEISKVCGKDIPAGRYMVSGNGIVKIETPDGDIKDIVITDGTIEGVEGVDKALATINNGDIITASPLKGMDQPAIRFERTDVSAETTGTRTGTSAAASTVPSGRPTVAPKNNPKTGEGSSETVALCGIMAVCAAVIGVLEIIKRKKFNS